MGQSSEERQKKKTFLQLVPVGQLPGRGEDTWFGEHASLVTLAN